MTPDTDWIKATASSTTGNCVEQRRHQGDIQVRDSKDKAGPALTVDPVAFAAWVQGAKAGEFDHLMQ